MVASQLVALLDSADIGTFCVSLATGEMVVSQKLVEHHGALPGPGTYMVQEVLDALPLETQQQILGGLAGCAETPARFECSLGRDGLERNLRLFAVIERDDGVPVALRGLVEDVTQERATEQILVRARAEASAASHAKTRFLANMSHEIRTPMNAVLGMTRLMLDTSLTGEQREYLRSVEVSGEALLGLINGVLDISKIEAGKLVLDEGRVRIHDLVHDVASSLAMRAHENGVEVIVDVDASADVEIEGDAKRLRQVLTNVLGNAVKFTAAGTIVVSATITSDRARGEELVLAVEDTGIGIAEDQLESIFTAFHQVDREATREYGGTGLGLSISRELVHLMGGEISARSEVDCGSTFEVRVPIRNPRPVSRSLDGIVQPRIGLLLGEPELARRLSARLQAMGVEVTVFADAAALLGYSLHEHAEKLHLVLDQDLGRGIQGIAVARRLVGCPSFECIALLARLPAHFTSDELQAAGIATHLRKPIRPETILDVIRKRQACAAPAVALPVVSRPPALVTMPAPPSGPLERVLIAEDDPLNARLACALVQKLGFAPVLVRDGRAAVQASAAEPFFAILMDLQMPVMNGLAATAEIRRRELMTNVHTRIYALTANAMAEDRESCMAAGMDGFIAKPFSMRELDDALHSGESRGVGDARSA